MWLRQSLCDCGCGPHKLFSPFVLACPSYIHYVLFSKLPLSSLGLLEIFILKKSMATHIHGMPLKNTTENNEFEEEEDETEEDEEESVGVEVIEESNLKRKRLNLEKKKGSNSEGPCCQVEKCGVDLIGAKKYYRRHKVCQVHAKAPIVVVAGLRQRFCQQCSRFHEVSEFDGTKRSCRRRLAGHNERRRKTPLAIKLEDNQCRQINGEDRPQITLTNRNASFKNYHIL